MISIILSSKSLIHSSALFILLLNAFNSGFVSANEFSNFSWLLVKLSSVCVCVCVCVYTHARALFRAALAYGSFPVGIGATAAGLCYSNIMPDKSHVCDLHQSSWQCQIINPLSRARD